MPFTQSQSTSHRCLDSCGGGVHHIQPGTGCSTSPHSLDKAGGSNSTRQLASSVEAACEGLHCHNPPERSDEPAATCEAENGGLYDRRPRMQACNFCAIGRTTPY
eukprot:scaffold244126_cov30-Tisochrysis_lutea.AAC.10